MSKLAEVKQIVHVCYDCMFSRTKGETVCTKMMPYKVSEDSMNSIPGWCPLPNVMSKDRGI